MAVKMNPKPPGAKSAVGETHAQKKGVDLPHKHFDFLVETEGGPTCNVNVNLGARIGLPEYSDVRFGASLTVPCDANETAAEMAFDFAKEWVEEKMEALRQELIDDE